MVVLCTHLYANNFIIPDCDRCSGVLKPDVVFFGENVPTDRIKLAMEKLSNAHGILVVGSSLMIYSGYRYVKAGHKLNKPLAAVNVGVTRADKMFELKISQACGRVLTSLIEKGLLG